MTPHRLTPSTHLQSLRSTPVPDIDPATPALLQSRLTRPNRASAASRSRSTASASETSVGTAMAWTPRASTLAVTSSSRGTSTSARTTFIPASANRSANARPIPLAAPVITAVFPASSCMPLSLDNARRSASIGAARPIAAGSCAEGGGT